MTAQDLIAFEDRVAALFNSGKLQQVVHLSRGNEDQLIEIFKDIRQDDWVLSTWRSHYHYLLKGGGPETLMAKIIAGQSLHVMDSALNFFSSAIVGGCCPIAVGIAMGIKRRSGTEKVYCFIGDGATDQGVFWESARYVDAHELPVIFILEDNYLAGDTPSSLRFGVYDDSLKALKCVRRYTYERKWPHCNTGTFVESYM